MAVDVEVGTIAVQLFTHRVGEPAGGEHVAGAEQGERVVGIETRAGEHLVGDGAQARIVGLKSVPRAGRLSGLPHLF